MIAVLLNVAAVLAGGTIGSLFGNKIKAKYTQGIMMAIGLLTLVIGIQGAICTSNILIVMVCLTLGTLLGVALGLDDRIEGLTETIRAKFGSGKYDMGKTAEAFITTTLVFCVGTMTVMGSIEAGLRNNYSILITKSIIDFVSATIFASALGPGVLLSALSVLIIQGGLVLLAGVAQPLLTTEVITEMSAVGGTLFIGMAINLTGISQKRIKIGDMLPSIFLPIFYFAIKGVL